MSGPKPWKEHKTRFLETLNQASSKTEANIYVRECIIYFYRAGYREDEIDKTEVLMKKVVKEWAYARYNVGTRPAELPKSETSGDFFDVRYFDPLLTYTVQIKGEDASWIQRHLRKYWDTLAHRRQDPEKARLDRWKISVLETT
jgi:hypothetical protein